MSNDFDADPALVNHAQSGHGPTGFDRGERCDYCADADGSDIPDYPLYGVAPHECYWRKGPEFVIGQSTLIPIAEWVDCFVPDLDDGETWADFRYPQACGTYFCPKCQDGYAEAWAAFVEKFGPPPSDSGRLPEGEDAPAAECEASQSGPKGIAQTTPSR